MSIRTDLALEAHEMYTQSVKNSENIDGVDVDVTQNDGIKVTKIKITNDNGAKTIGKPIGKYVTIESPEIKYDVNVYEKTCKIIADEIKGLSNIQSNTKTLVAGLGNKEITPDALGPSVVSQLMITNHMKENMKDFFGDNITSVCAIAPGVLGTTGIETSQIISGVCAKVKPDIIIAVDALAARSLDRLSTTIQISDTGITPGAGVGNRRDELSKETTGAKVISIGVATVVDALTIALDSIDRALEDINQSKAEEDKNNLIKEKISKNISSLIVTPKDIDSVIEKISKTVANGINLALHKNLTFEEIESFVG